MSPNDQETVHLTDTSNTASANNSTYTSVDTSYGGQDVWRHNSITSTSEKICQSESASR